MEDYKFVIKKRGIKGKKNRRKILKTFSVILMVIFIVIGGGYCYSYLQKHFHSPFYVKNIEVIDAKNVNIKKLNAFLENFRGRSLTSISFDKMSRELKKFEWIKDVIIHKNYPSTLIVEIIEVTPIGILNSNDRFYLIGDNGKLIEHFNSKFLGQKLFIFTTKSVGLYSIYKDEILKLYDIIKKNNIKNISEIVMAKDVKIITYKPYRKYLISLNNIEENFSKIKLVTRLEKNLFLNNINFREVNLKYNNKIFIKTLGAENG